MKVRFVDFGQQYEDHKREYDHAIQRCLTMGRLVLQDELENFEKNLAEFLGMKYAVGVASGTDALKIALRCKDLDTFVTTSGYTFKATHEAIWENGARPEMVDVDENRLAHDVNVPVHIEGMVAPSEHAIVEDACQAIGAEGIGYSGTACYSFYPAKILGGLGDGGAIVTNDKKLADKARLLRHHWQTDENEEMGYCSRLDNINAAFLNVKLQHLPDILQRRKEIAMRYKTLSGVVDLPFYQEGRVWQDYVIETDDSEELAMWLTSNGIQTLGQGMTPPHIAQKTGKKLMMTDKLYKRMLRLPCNETLSDAQVDFVIEKVKEYYG